MTERQKVADLPQEEREQLIKRAADAGIRNAMIATWYVDTLEAKIAAATAKKNETPADDAAPGTDESQQTDEQTDDQDDEKTKAAKETSSQVVKICHICRGKVINGKCSSCGFEISKR